MTAQSRTEWISPSLAAAPEGSNPAYEMKFLVSSAVAGELETWASDRFNLDPHADSNYDNCYQVNTVYFDTPLYDVLHRSPAFRRDKYRIRRYGADALSHIERKSKKNGRVWKVRHTIPTTNLLANERALTDVPEWFVNEITGLQLQPVCRLSYLRKAFYDAGQAGSLRITIDRNAMGTRADQTVPLPVMSGLSLLQEEAIVEFKFLSHLPVIFKDAIEIFRLIPTTISKYRRWGRLAGLIHDVKGCCNA